MADTMMMSDPKRARLEMRIMEELQRLDETTLRELEAWLAQPAADAPPQGGRSGMTRRQMLVASLLGGAAVVGAGVGGSLVGQSSGVTQGLSDGAEAVAEMGETVSAWQQRAEDLGSQLSGAGELLDLYDRMDSVGLDDVVSSGLSAVAALLERGAQSAARLREGLVTAQNHINQLDEGLAVLDAGLVRAEEAVSRLSGLMQALEDRLREAGEPVAPLTEALGSFFTGLISRIPFGVGERILGTIERIQAVIGAIPESIENINSDLIEPLRQRFFPREGDDVQVRLLEPLTDLIFLPAQALLSTIANLAETWKSALAQPATAAIEEREAIRKQIRELRAKSDF